MTGKDFVKSLRKYKDKPWVEMGRNPDLGVDCVGLIICALKDLGFNPKDEYHYTKYDEFLLLVKGLKQDFKEIEKKFFPYEGALILFRGREIFNHVGVYTGFYDNKHWFIHSLNKDEYNKVIEQPYEPYWMMNTHSFHWHKELEIA